MDKKQYNNVIRWTLKQQDKQGTNDSVTTARAIFNNMGVALPQGDCKEIADILKTNDYMAWRACSKEEAQQAVDNGIAAIGINQDTIVVLSANDEERPVIETASVMTLSESTTNNTASNMQYYSYGYGVTTDTSCDRVTGITLSASNFEMAAGSTVYLSAIVSPSTALNKTVIWSSSNKEVATVDSFTGEVNSKRAGRVMISAVTAEGGYSASCIVTVIEKVTIEKDGAFNKVIFNSTGKVWRCINHDMIYDENYMGNNIMIQRSYYNYYPNYDSSNPSTVGVIRYSDDEIKLLYAIDPYGVAEYVRMYASSLFYEKGLEGVLGYKDRIFRLLFNREPKYFARTLDGSTWYETTDKSNLSAVQSESESVFGMHPIWDDYTILQIIEAAATMVDIALTFAFTAPKVAAYLRVHKTANTIAKIFSFTASSIGSGFISAITDTFIEKQFEQTSLSWAYDIVSLYSSLNELVSDFDFGENYYQQIFDYCANDLHYNVYVEFQNGQKYQLKEISAIIANN